jgi:hypothetical protein
LGSALCESGKLIIEQVDAAEMSPGEFARKVRSCVDAHGNRTVVIDSLNGYQATMLDEKALLLHVYMSDLLTRSVGPRVEVRIEAPADLPAARADPS